MTWVLVALLVWPHAEIVGTAKFDSETLCEEALARVQATKPKAFLICVPVEVQE